MLVALHWGQSVYAQYWRSLITHDTEGIWYPNLNLPRQKNGGSMKPHLVQVRQTCWDIINQMDNVTSVLPFLEVSRERQQDIYHLGGDTCFLYVKTQKSCHATYHRPVMVAATAYKARRSKNFNSRIIRNSYNRKLVVALTKIRELHSVFTYQQNIYYFNSTSS